MTVARALPDGSPRTIHVVQGGYEISSRPEDTLTTILGSCVATCLCDPVTAVGGINHFLLPDSAQGGGDQLRYGLHSMELLINALLKAGASRTRLQAKLFGGAAMSDGLAGIGRANAEFATRFLTTEGIPCISQSLGGHRGRRIRYWPTSGRAQMRFLEEYDSLPVELPPRPARKPVGDDDVTFF